MADNPYLDDLNNEQAQQAAAIRANGQMASGTAPDMFASLRATAKQLNLPTDAVTNAPAVPQRQIVGQTIDQNTQGAPVARQAYTDADFAKLGHDDSHNVGLLDRFMGWAGNSPIAARIASAATAASPIGMASNALNGVGSLLGYKPGDLQASFGHGMVSAASDVVKGIGALGDMRDQAVHYVTGGNPIASMLLDRTLAAISPLAVVPDMASVQPATTWLDSKSQELENSVQTHGRLAQAATMAGGIVPYLLSGEFAPITMALSGVGQGAEAAQVAGKYGTAAGNIGELANGGFQALVGHYLGGETFANLAPQFGDALADGIASRIGGGTANVAGRVVGGLAGDLTQGITNIGARALGGAALGTAMQGGSNLIERETVNPDKSLTDGLSDSAEQMAMLDLGLHGLHMAGQSIGTRYAQAANGEAGANIADGLNLIAQASKVRERAPDVFHSYLQAVTDAHGAPDDVYVSPHAFAETFSTPEGLVALSHMPEAVQDAVLVSAKTGGDVKIPTADFGTYVSGTPLYAQLADHIKFDPNSFTRSEAADIMQTEGPRVLAELDRVVKQKAATDQFSASRDAVEQTIKGQLDDAGRFSPEVNAINAKLGAHSIATMAARIGMTPEEFHAAHGFTVGDGEARTGSQALEQSNLDGLRAHLDSLGVDHAISERADRLTVNKIVVPDGERGKGVGSGAMKAITDYADQHGKRVALSPSTDFGGTSKARLTDFYKRFGFAENKGRGRDLSVSESMIREPQVLKQGDEQGPFGPRFTQFKGDAQGAIAHLMEAKDGEAVGALHHPDIGDIDLPWGEEGSGKSDGYGLAKLARYHPGVLDNLQELISGMHVRSRSDNRINLESADHAAGIRLTWDDQAKHWLVTAFRKNEGVADTTSDTIGSGDEGDTARFTDASDAVVARKIEDFHQSNSGEARGQFIPDTNTINLLKNANLSTFIHELGHYHLEALANFSGAHEDIGNDFATALKWMDPDLTPEKWAEMGFEERRPLHEQFAQGFEKYLMEGNAPSRELRGVFQRMSAWLRNVYRAVKGMGTDLSPEVRQVMDRLVATPDEVRGAERDMNYLPAFESKPEFMSDDQWSDYQRMGLQATLDATEKLGTRTVKDLQWLEGAKSRELKKMQADNAGLRKSVRDEIVPQVMTEPVNRAREFLKFGRIDGQAIDGDHKLSIEGVAKALGFERAKANGRASKAPPFEKRGQSLIEWISRNGGIWDGGGDDAEFKGGDLKAMGLGEWHKDKPFRKKAIRDPSLGHGNRGADTIQTDAIGAGYFPELAGGQHSYEDLHDVSHLHNAINDELSGKPRYAGIGQADAGEHPYDHEEQAAEKKFYSDWIEEAAEEHFGIDKGTLDPDFLEYAGRLKMEGMDAKTAFMKTVNDYAADAIHEGFEEDGDNEYGNYSDGQENPSDADGQDGAAEADGSESAPVGDSATPLDGGGGLAGKDHAEVKAALGYGKYGILARDKALDPEIVADQFGYASAKEMLHDLVTAPTAKDRIRDLTDQTMLERYGDVSDPKRMAAAALEAVHNDARGRLLATEFSALEKALGRKSDLRDAAKDMAEKVVGDMKVADLKPDRFLAEERKAGEKTERAIRDNDLETAAAQKRAQILNFHLAKAVDAARDETAKALTYFKKLDAAGPRKAMGGEAAAQIDAILDRYDLRSSTTNKEIAARQTLVEWAANQTAQGFDPQIDPAQLNEANRQAFRTMTLDQVRALRDTVKSIDWIGRQEQKVLDGQRRIALDKAVDEVIHNTIDMPKLKVSDVRNPDIGGKGLDRFSGKFMKAQSFVRSADAAMLKLEQLFDWLDRKDLNGPFNRLVFRRLADAQGVENDMLHEIAGKMSDLAEALPKDERNQLAERFTVPELIDSKTGKPSILAKSQLLSIALNSANESNFGKMLSGEKWEAADVKAALDRHLSSADIDYVNGVVRTIESLWPKISAMQERLSGVAPEKIEGRPFELANGTIEGGYFPVVYDPTRSLGAERHEALDASQRADQMFDAQYVKATTAKGHTIERTGYSAPLLLDLNVIPRHISQVVHDLAYREAIMDADRFLSDNRVRGAITETMGKEYYQQIRPWLKAIANDRVIDQQGQAWFDKIFHWGRTTATMVGLGFRASTMLIHGTSAASNSVGEIGADWMRKGMASFIGSPDKMRDAYSFVQERSSEMRNRMNEVDRDVRESLRELELRSAQGSTAPLMRAIDKGRSLAFWGIGAIDMASAMPTWMGAYLKAMEAPERGGQGLSEDDAIYAADKAVRNAHGGTGVKDLARVQRGSEAEKLFTMFYSFWNHVYNRQRDIARDAINIRSVGDFGNVLARSWFYLVIPQLLHGLLKTPSQNSQNEEGTGTSWLHWAAQEIGLGFTSGIPVLRDLANGVAEKGFNKEALNDAAFHTPAANAIVAPGVAGVDAWRAAHGRPVKNAGKDIANAAGVIFDLPLGQAGTTGQYLWDVIDGDQRPQDIGDWWNGVVYGKQKH